MYYANIMNTYKKLFYKEEFALGFRRLLDLLIDTEKEIHLNLIVKELKIC